MNDPLDIKLMPHGLDKQGRYPTRKWPDTVPTDHAPLVQPDELRKRAKRWRTLCAMCLGSWAIPVLLLAIVTRCGG